MTVKSIPQADKDEYCLRYTLQLNTIEDLMDDSGRSRRTVIRMLEEQGIHVPMHRRNRKSKPKAVKVEQPFAGLTDEETFANLALCAPLPPEMFDADYVLQPTFFVFKGEPEPESKALFMGLINRVKRVFAAVMA